MWSFFGRIFVRLLGWLVGFSSYDVSSGLGTDLLGSCEVIDYPFLEAYLCGSLECWVDGSVLVRTVYQVFREMINDF